VPFVGDWAKKLDPSLHKADEPGPAYETYACEFRFLKSDDNFQAANNPAIDYGLLYVPCPLAYPGYSADPQDHPCDRTCNTKQYTKRFSLEESDAVLLFGWTVPEAVYFSFLPYQACRVNQEGEAEGTLSSIGLGLNDLTLKTRYGAPDPYRAFFALVVSADMQTASDVTDWMRYVGVPEEAINTYSLPHTFTNRDNTLNLVARIIYGGEGTDAYLDYPPIKGYLIRYVGNGTGRELVQSVPVWDDLVVEKDIEVRMITTPDDPAKPNYMGLFVDTIKAFYTRKENCDLRLDVRANLRHKDPEVCRADPPDPIACLHDNPDAVFAGFPVRSACSLVPNNPTNMCFINEAEALQDVIIMAGVNHSLFPGLAVSFTSYTLNKYSATDVDGMVGLKSFLSDDALGSSQQFWPGDTKPAFIAVTFAFDCDFDGDGTDDPFCVPIPASDDPANAFYAVTGRIYLDEETTTGPHPCNFVPPRLLWFTGAGCKQ
jgi:hypothetical protein